MLTREHVSPLVEVTDSKPQTVWANWYLAWQNRLADVGDSMRGMLRKPLQVQLPNNDQKMSLALAALLATLLYVSSLALLVHFVLGHAADGMDVGLRSSMTIEVLNPTAEQKDWRSADERIKILQENIRKIKGVQRVEPVPFSHMRDLLKPWLGDRTSLDALPLPMLLDVQLDPHAGIDRKAINAAVNAVDGAMLDDHGQFMNQLTRFGASMRSVSLYVVVLGLLALILSAYFAAQATFYMNREMIGILHLIGAEENAIAQHTGMAILRLMLLSVSVALGLTLLTLVLVLQSGAGIDFSFFPNFNIGFFDWLFLVVQWIALFGFAIFMCLLAARFTVLQALRRLL
jgi:cell division transport system permease protein